MIGRFLATLELVRQRKVRVVQPSDAMDEVSLEIRPEEDQKVGDDKPADWRNATTGEIDYEWPSEKDRLRAERRLKLRATYANKRKSDEELEDAMDELDQDAPAKEGETPMQEEQPNRRKKQQPNLVQESEHPADHADSIAVIDAAQAHADDDAGDFDSDAGTDAE